MRFWVCIGDTFTWILQREVRWEAEMITHLLGACYKFTPPLHLFPRSLTPRFSFLSVEVQCLHPKMQVWSFTHSLLVKAASSAPKIDNYSNFHHQKACRVFRKCSQIFTCFSKPFSYTDHLLIELHECTFRKHALSLKTGDGEFQECGISFLTGFLLIKDPPPLWCSFYENTDRTKPICWQPTVRVGYWKGSRWVLQAQSQTSKADDGQHAVDIALLFCFWPGVKITDTVYLSPFLQSLLLCARTLDPKHLRKKFFWIPTCWCDYRQIDTLWCPQPAHPAGTGNDAIYPALTLPGPREATASLTKKILSVSLSGWLCPVIVMLARLWHLCYVDGKCLSNHLLAAQLELSSTLMDSYWRIIITKMKSSLTLNATAAAPPWRCPTVLVTKAADGPPRGRCPLTAVLQFRG